MVVEVAGLEGGGVGLKSTPPGAGKKRTGCPLPIGSSGQGGPNKTDASVASTIAGGFGGALYALLIMDRL